MTPKELEVKKRHHHVWANYLLRWGNGTNDVHYTTKTGKIAEDSVRGIVVEDYFYKSTTLNNMHLDEIKAISNLAPKFMQKAHSDILNTFLAVQNLEKVYLEQENSSDEINQMLHALKCNMLENHHSLNESIVLPILSALADGDEKALDSPKCMTEFLLFIGHQFARTKNFREGVIKIAETSTPNDITSQAMVDAWWFFSYMFGMNIGAKLCSKINTSTHTLLINHTEKPFITSDQPVINAYPIVDRNVSSPTEMVDFYYPISPQVAFIACESKSFRSGRHQVDETLVEDFNRKIAAQAFTHIIGNSKPALAPYKKLVGKRYREFFLKTK